MRYPNDSKGSTYTVYITDHESGSVPGAEDRLAYRVLLGSPTDPDAVFKVEWLLNSGTSAETGTVARATRTRRLITDFEAYKSLYIPWTLGLQMACQEENESIMEAFSSSTRHAV